MAKAKRKPSARKPSARAAADAQEAREFAATLRGVIVNLPPLLNDGEAHRERLVAFLTKKAEG